MRNTKKPDKRDILNQIINFFWTALCFTPVFWFWFQEGIDNIYFYVFLGIALLFGALPGKILSKFTLSADKKVYEKYGIKFIRKFVQNGDIVNSHSKAPGATSIKDKVQAREYLKTLAMYERYHWVCLIFFLLTTIYVFFNEHFLFDFLF
ncbi:hypothetical protein KRR40_34125 [Niabella defluvii]|nr:hypothetical protein KRR40_34125 [Niabella sp. I65]